MTVTINSCLPPELLRTVFEHLDDGEAPFPTLYRLPMVCTWWRDCICDMGLQEWVYDGRMWVRR